MSSIKILWKSLFSLLLYKYHKISSILTLGPQGLKCLPSALYRKKLSTFIRQQKGEWEKIVKSKHKIRW